MIAPHAFVYVRSEDQSAVGRAVLQVNSNRHQRFFYRSLILTSPARGWVALVLGSSGTSDHLLLRNLSGLLNTLAFELQLGAMNFAYRLHRQGRTVSAFESNLLFYVNNCLQMIRSPRDFDLLDLAEPIDRFVLERLQKLQHPGLATGAVLEIPDRLQDYYAGDAAQLRPVLRGDADEAYVASLLAPGFNPEVAFERLAALLDLPYLPSDCVTVPVDDREARQVTGYAITKPATWRDALPPGWRRMPAQLPGIL